MTSKLDHIAPPSPHEAADAELTATIKMRIVACGNAVSPPEFQVSYSVHLIASMLQALPVRKGGYVVLNSKAWACAVGDTSTVAVLDPTSRRTAVLAGHLGVMFGIEVFTDCYYSAEDRILPEDCARMYVMSADGSTGYSVKLA